MKKFLLFTGAIAMMTISCKNQETETVEAPDTVIVQEAPEATPNDVPPPPPPAVEEADGTSIKVGSDGVTLDTKDGTKKTTVDVREGGAVLEVKK